MKNFAFSPGIQYMPDINISYLCFLRPFGRSSVQIVNAESNYEGLWTRIEGDQKSVIDYVIVTEGDTKLIQKMEIDEARKILPHTTKTRIRKEYTQITAW